MGATSRSGTAVTLSGTAADDGSGPISVAIYNGAIAPANLIGTTGVTAGTWSLSTTLAAGTYGAVLSERSRIHAAAGRGSEGSRVWIP